MTGSMPDPRTLPRTSYLTPAPTPFPRGFLKGLTYPAPSSPEMAWGTENSRAILGSLVQLGASSVSFCPFFVMDRKHPFTVRPHPRGSDRETLKRMILEARALGLFVVLRPQLVNGKKLIALDLDLAEKAHLAPLFVSLEGILLDLASLAQETGCNALSLGTRLQQFSGKAPERWTALIRKVRGSYRGLLTYDADFRHELGQVTFWDQLDVISVTVYKRMHRYDDEDDPPRDDRMLERSRSVSARMANLHYKHHKPVWISEVGFPTIRRGAYYPFQRPLRNGAPDPRLQGRLLHATLLAYQSKRWLSGLFVWGIESAGGPDDKTYSPLGKDAWGELGAWFKPGPERDEAYYAPRDLVSWVDDWF